MKVLSVQQPWATMICSGIKDVENRTWKPKENPGRILIHASKKFSMNMLGGMPLEWASTISNDILFGNLPQANEFPYGAIIGYVTLDRIETESDSLWASPDESQYKWILKDAYMFDKPIEGVKGKLHLFDYPIDENNLPAAHKVEIRMPKHEGDELVVPLAKANWDGYAMTKDNSDELYLTFDIAPNVADVLCKPDVYDLLPVQSVRLECEGKSLRFEVDGNSSTSYYDVDDDMKHLLYGSIFTDEPIERLLCVYFFGKKLTHVNIELDEIEKLVDEELKENGFTRDDFSAEELKDLKDEIKDRLELPRGFMLDGFWSSEGPGLRRQFEKEIGLWPKD